jgi:hypothetical protein
MPAFRGEVGQIRWGYHVAAELRDYHVQADGAGGALLRAKVKTRDVFSLAQRPLAFVAPVRLKHGETMIQSHVRIPVVRVVDLSLDNWLTAVLARPEG